MISLYIGLYILGFVIVPGLSYYYNARLWDVPSDGYDIVLLIFFLILWPILWSSLFVMWAETKWMERQARLIMHRNRINSLEFYE